MRNTPEYCSGASLESAGYERVHVTGEVGAPFSHHPQLRGASRAYHLAHACRELASMTQCKPSQTSSHPAIQPAPSLRTDEGAALTVYSTSPLATTSSRGR